MNLTEWLAHMNPLEKKLIGLGLREEYDEPRTLRSGLKSKVFWNIEKLFEYPEWMRVMAIGDFIYAVGLCKPRGLIGIKTGGLLLARLLKWRLDVRSLFEYDKTYAWVCDNCILVDDVMTTGGTVKAALSVYRGEVTHIAVLVNRSGMNELEGVPIISGVSTDQV